MRYLAGQRVTVDHAPASVVGECSIVDDHGDTVSVLTQYEARGSVRFVQGVPRSAVAVLGPRAPHEWGGEDQRARGAIERLAGRMVKHGESVSHPMGASEAFDRSKAVADRNHR